MTDLENRIIEDSVEEAKAQGVKVIALPSMVRSIHPVKDFKALLSLTWLIFKEKPDIFIDKDIIDLLYLKLNQTIILAHYKVNEIGPDDKHCS